MVQHFYNNISEEGSLSAGVGTGTAIFTLTGAGLGTMPTIPFYVRIDPDLATEEICEVTAGSTATSLNVTRGYDGTSAFSHSIGAKVRVCVPSEFYNKADAHVEASTNVHGLSGGAAVVGTTSTQTLTNKTINSSVLDLAHSTSPSASQAVKVSANAATGRDGFYWDNTGGSTGRAFVARSGGADKFVVAGDGIITSSAKANLNEQVEMGLQAPATATARFITRVRPTQPAWELKDEGGFNIASVGASGNIDASGYIATASTLSSAGAATLNSLAVTNAATVGTTLGVTGASTLNSLSVTNNATVGGTLGVTGAQTFTGAGAFTNGYTSFGGSVKNIATVGALANVTSPAAHQLAYLTTDRTLYKRNAANTVWEAVAHWDETTHGSLEYVRSSGTQSINSGAVTKVTFPTSVQTTSLVTVSGTNNTDFLLNRTGKWLIDFTIAWAGATGPDGGGERWGMVGLSGDSNTRYLTDARSAVNIDYNTNTSARVRYFTSGTSLSVYAFQNQGAAVVLTPSSATGEQHFGLTWLGP